MVYVYILFTKDLYLRSWYMFTQDLYLRSWYMFTQDLYLRSWYMCTYYMDKTYIGVTIYGPYYLPG